MFDSLRNLKYEQAIQVASYTKLALDRRMGPKELASVRLMYKAKSEPTPTERRHSVKLLNEIETTLGHPIKEADTAELHRIQNELYSVLNDLSGPKITYDPEYAESLRKSLSDISPYQNEVNGVIIKPSASRMKPAKRSAKSKKSTVSKRKLVR